MSDLCGYVNVFQGCGEIALPVPDGPAAGWHFIKGLSGNTAPGAQLPFGRMTVEPYSGGYPSGYGSNTVNCGEPVRHFFDGGRLIGLAHLCQSGTGCIDIYYNYALTSPTFAQSPADAFALRGIEDEQGRPGYYSAVFKDEGIKAEASASNDAAFHRYSFPRGGGRVYIDFNNDGLDFRPGSLEHASALSVSTDKRALVRAEAVLKGVKLYFSVSVSGASGIELFNGGSILSGDTVSAAQSDGRCGCAVEAAGREICLTVAISSVSAQKADEYLASAAGKTVDEVSSEARRVWEEYLSAVEIEASDRDREIFYSNLYHSLTKPNDWTDDLSENVFGMVDFCTMWDIYKTQLPLLMSLYRGVSVKIAETFLNAGRSLKSLPNCLPLSSERRTESGQACMLPEYMLADAYYHGLVSDVPAMLDACLNDILSGPYDEYISTGAMPKTTKTLDLSEICLTLSQIAAANGCDALSARFKELYDAREEVFDARTGLMRQDSEYYEGTYRNYSFRPLHDMDARIAKAGGKEGYTLLLNKFFGFVPDDKGRDDRFEGFNNESDMEAPYAYHYAGRHDRLCAVTDAMYRYSFTTGRGGIPGNNDSGGLSACYIWNVLGIFPVSGQDLMIVSCPKFRRSVLRLANGNALTIVNDGDLLSVTQAELNGAPLPELTMTVSQFMSGGTLRVR